MKKVGKLAELPDNIRQYFGKTYEDAVLEAGKELNNFSYYEQLHQGGKQLSILVGYEKENKDENESEMPNVS